MLRGWIVLTLRVFWLGRLTLPENRGGIGVSPGVRLEDGDSVRGLPYDPGIMYVLVRAVA